jgi:glycosyltransferase involved in cell wall biosynthesis
MKTLTVWILQTGEPLHIDDGNPRPMRAINSANILIEKGHKVVLWSSAFNHSKKEHRVKKIKVVKVSEGLEIKLIPSPGYQNNISLRRFCDHAVLAFNLSNLLKAETHLPDVVFIGYPPIETALVMTEWSKRQNIPSLLDVKDQWPLSFLDPLPSFLKPIGRIILSPYYFLAKKTFAGATGISTMAESYLQWSLEFARRDRRLTDGIFPLTSSQGSCSNSDLAQAKEWWDKLNVKCDAAVTRIVFIGSHVSVFDFEPVRVAAEVCLTKNLSVEFIICGDGNSSQELRQMMANLANVYFPGWIDRPKIEALAERSHASLAPYQNIDSFMRSLPNKIIDSLSLGLPILSPLEGEVAQLIMKHQVGLNYGGNTEQTLYECINNLVENPNLQKKLSQNALSLYQEKFDYYKVYGSLVIHLEQLVSNFHFQK